MRKAMSKKVVALVVAATIMSTTVVPAVEIKKDESVFVNLSSDGKLEKSTVSNWIHSSESNLEVKDKSSLSDIKNVKTDDEPVKDGENLTWKVEGSDIYYQGKTDKELPLDVSIKYSLDGEEIKAEDLAGKTGRVKIELEIKNKIYKETSINGKTRKIYTPFTTASSIILPVDKFKNVKSDGGVTISEGNNNIIGFVAFPGLQESLGIDNLDIGVDLKDKLVVEADVDNFEMGPIMITATPELPDLSALDKANSIDELKDSLNQLKDGSDKLLDGTGKLKDGIDLAKTKLISASNLLKTQSLQEKMSLITNEDKTERARKLIKDAYFAKDIDFHQANVLISMLDAENVNKAMTLMEDYQRLATKENKELLSSTLNMIEDLEKDNNFTRLMSDIIKTKDGYDSIDKTTKIKLQQLLSQVNPTNIKAVQGLLVDVNVAKTATSPIIEEISREIKSAGGTSNYLYGLNKNLKTASSLIDSSNKLESLQGDMTAYASSYMILKAQLAAAASQGGETGFAQKKEELKYMINAVYSQSSTEAAKSLINYIDSLNISSVSSNALAQDGAKINEYNSTLPSLVQGVKSMENMKPLIDTASNVLSNQENVNALGKFFNDINDPTTQGLIKSFGEGIMSLSDEDLSAIGETLNNINNLAKDLETNKSNIENITALVSGLSNNTELKNNLVKFKADIESSSELISELEGLLKDTKPSDVEKIRSLSSQLMSMQNDLKNSEDILRITNDALRSGNVFQARNLISALPSLEKGISELSTGSKELSDGMKTFHDDGINKLYTEGNNTISSIDDVIAAKDELVKASKEFSSFTGKGEEMDGSVKFIMKTDEVKIEDKAKEEKKEVKEEKKGFFAWLKSLIFGED